MSLNTSKIKEMIVQKYGVDPSKLKRLSKSKDSEKNINRLFDAGGQQIIVKSDPKDENVLEIELKKAGSCPISNPQKFVFCYNKPNPEVSDLLGFFTIFPKAYWDKEKCVDDQTDEELYELSSEGFFEAMESAFEYEGDPEVGLAKLRSWGFIESAELEAFLAKEGTGY